MEQLFESLGVTKYWWDLLVNVIGRCIIGSFLLFIGVSNLKTGVYASLADKYCIATIEGDLLEIHQRSSDNGYTYYGEYIYTVNDVEYTAFCSYQHTDDLPKVFLIEYNPNNPAMYNEHQNPTWSLIAGLVVSIWGLSLILPAFSWLYKKLRGYI